MNPRESSKTENITLKDPSPVTPAENIVLFIKLLAGAGILILLFWFLDRLLVK